MRKTLPDHQTAHNISGEANAGTGILATWMRGVDEGVLQLQRFFFLWKYQSFETSKSH